MTKAELMRVLLGTTCLGYAEAEAIADGVVSRDELIASQREYIDSAIELINLKNQIIKQLGEKLDHKTAMLELMKDRHSEFLCNRN